MAPSSEAEAVVEVGAPTLLKGTAFFERTVNLGNYESVKAGISVQFDYTPEDTEESLISKGRDAFFVAKSVVFEQLGIDATLEASGVVTELVKQAFPGSTVEPQAAPYVQEGLPPAPAGDAGSVPPEGKEEFKAWAKARFATHPQEFFDNRPKKANGEYKPNAPDLKHKDTKKGVWLS